MSTKVNDYVKDLQEKLDGVYYAKVLSYLAKELGRVDHEYLRIEINILISKYRNLQLNILKGKSTFDVVDALGACMVLDMKQAKNILYHASVYSSVSRQISFQVLLDDLMVEHEGAIGIPYFKQNQRTGFIEFVITNKDLIEKDLCDTHFKGHDYTPKYTLKHGTITNYYEIGKRLLRFFKYYDWKISKDDLKIFYITLTQISKEKTTPLEIDLTRDKINFVFFENADANRELCTLIDLSRNYITSIIDLRDSLSEYFTRGTGLSSSTLRKYLSEDVYIKENLEKFETKVETICKI